MSKVRPPLIAFAVALALVAPLCIFHAGELGGPLICLLAIQAFPSGLIPFPLLGTLFSGEVMSGSLPAELIGWAIYLLVFRALLRSKDRDTYRRTYIIFCTLLTLNVAGCYSPLLRSIHEGPPSARVMAARSRRILHHAEVADPVGDAIPTPLSDVVPDLVGAVVEVSDATATFRIRLAPGTLDVATQVFWIGIDIDHNPMTGNSGIDDYVFIEEPEGRAQLRKVTGTSSTPAGMLPVTVGPNQCEVSIPLSLLGNFDGRFDFQVRALLRSPRTIQDVLPDVGFAHIQ